MPPLRAAFEVAAAVGLVLHFVLVLRVWGSLPDRVPTHFGVSGQPDSWGPKWELLALPFIGLVLYAGMTWLGRRPQKFNYLSPVGEHDAARQHGLAQTLVSAIKAEVTWLFAAITWQSVRVAEGRAEGLGEWFVPVILVVVAVTIITYLVSASRTG